LRRVIGKPPGEEVEQLAAYPSFAEITTSITSDPLVARLREALLDVGRVLNEESSFAASVQDGNSREEE
jgi:hypothetical protein